MPWVRGTRYATVSRGAARNAAPTITVPGAQSAVSNVALAITGTSIADADGNTQTVALTVSQGTMTLASTTGLSFSVGDGTADATMTFSGSVTNINTAIATITYTATEFYSGSDSLAITANDGAGGTDSDSITITVTSQFLTSLVGYWKLENVNDSHTNGLTLTNNNSVTFTSGKVNNAATLTVSGSKSLSRTSSSTIEAGDSDFSIAFWMNPSNLSAIRNPVAKWGTGGNDWHMQLNTDGSITWSVFGDSGATAKIISTSAGVVTAGNWYFVYGEHELSSKKIAISVNAGSLTQSTAATWTNRGTCQAAFKVGEIGTLGRYWDGQVDEVGLWFRKLTGAERTQLYNSGTGVTYPTFV